MDFARSCQRRRMKFSVGGFHATATWFFCHPDAKPFPYEHTFSLGNWDIVHPTPTTLGDDATQKRVWYNGRRLNRSTGQTFAGPLEFFQHGCPGPGAIPRAFDGTPIECLSAPFGKAGGGFCLPTMPAVGGKRVSGGSSPSVTPGMPCANCSSITPAIPVVTIAGAAGFAAGLNGTWTLTQQPAGCTWQRVLGFAGSIVLNRFPGGNWQVALGVPFNPSAGYSNVTADCVTPTVIPQVFGPPQYPPTVALSFN